MDEDQGSGQPDALTTPSKGASGAAFIPRLAKDGVGKALENPNAGILGPKEQQTCYLTEFFLPPLNTWLFLSQGIK